MFIVLLATSFCMHIIINNRYENTVLELRHEVTGMI